MSTITNPGNAYVLNKGSQGIGFYKLSESGIITAGKAYLTYSASSAKGFFPFDTVTGMETMFDVRSKMADVWYDMSGRKLDAKPTRRGFYIANGQKVFIK